MQPVLFYGVPQGSSFGSIVALEWLGQPYQLCRIEMLQHPWNPLYGYINPLYLTPALLLEDGQTLTESFAILMHLANRGLDQGLGFRQGTRKFDRLNQMLAYLNTDFYAAFNPLWTADEMPDLEPADRELLRTVGRAEVAKNCAYLDTFLVNQEWLLGGKTRTLADAYLAGIGRWVDYHQLFDLQQMYPNLHRYLQKLKSDPAVLFAEAIENDQAAIASSKFMGHVTLEELHAASRMPQVSRLVA
ncbi:MAG: glutathione S-transferase family protein [Tildeniella nuda ZEHNDER 1965/U140]|jgi:glutathione S-transferase|nr:glutathione S-transferase family protein [Tildeniella nuda ZEHNDER 1965/U140]